MSATALLVLTNFLHLAFNPVLWPKNVSGLPKAQASNPLSVPGSLTTISAL